MRGSGRPVAKSLALGTSDTNSPRTDRIDDACVDSDHGRDVWFFERPNIQSVHLVMERLMGDLRVGLGQGSEERSKVGVLACELDSEVGKATWQLLRSSESCKQRDAPRCPSSNVLSAIIWVVVVFPVPAIPFSG